jgi:hypothetical protein
MRVLKQSEDFFLFRQVQEEVLSIYLCILAKAAVADFAAVIVTVHVLVPEHAPDQPEKVDPLVAEAVRVTDVPEL